MIKRWGCDNEVLPPSPELTPEYIALVEELRAEYQPWDGSFTNKAVIVQDFPIANHLVANALTEIPVWEASGIIFSGGPSEAYKYPLSPEALLCGGFAAWNRAKFGNRHAVTRTLWPIIKRRPAGRIIFDEYKEVAPGMAARLKGNVATAFDDKSIRTYEYYINAEKIIFNQHFPFCGGVVIIAPAHDAFRLYHMARHVFPKCMSVEIIPFHEVQTTHAPQNPTWYNFRPFGPRWMASRIKMFGTFSHYGDAEREVKEKGKPRFLYPRTPSANDAYQRLLFYLDERERGDN